MNLLSARDRAREVLGPELVDTCQVLRLNPSAFDPAIDPQTHRIAPDDDREEVIYDGPALLVELLRQRRLIAAEGGGAFDHQSWTVLLPAAGSPVIVARDVVIFTASHNPQAVGIRFLVPEIHRHSVETFRSFLVQDEAGSLQRP